MPETAGSEIARQTKLFKLSPKMHSVSKRFTSKEPFKTHNSQFYKTNIRKVPDKMPTDKN